MPVPSEPITSTRAATSSHDARREATGRSSEVSWCSLRDVENPIAPARIASSRWRAMRSRSSASAVSSKARSPIAQVRRAEWPTLAAKLMAFGRPSTASRYSAKDSNDQSMPSASAVGSMSSARSRLRTTSARSADRTGASVNPQFPITAVVTPCQHELLPDGSQNTWASMWVWPSTKPGVTTCPSASISRAPRSSTRPTRAMRSPTMPTSATKDPRPEPSTTRPPRITTSYAIASVLPGLLGLPAVRPDPCRAGG